MDAILPVDVLLEGLPESDCELCQGHPETVDRSGTGTVRDVWSRELCEGTCQSLHQALADLRLDGLLALIAMTYGRLGDLFVGYATPNNCRERVENSTRIWKPPHAGR